MHVSGTALASPVQFPGDSVGTPVTVKAGSYAVTEDAVAGYSGVPSSDCTGTLSPGDNKTCTITNTDVAPKLTVIKTVVNNSGGTKTAGDFTMTVTGNTPTPGSFPGSAAGTVVTLKAGAYSVGESSVTGYTQTAASA